MSNKYEKIFENVVKFLKRKNAYVVVFFGLTIFLALWGLKLIYGVPPPPDVTIQIPTDNQKILLSGPQPSITVKATATASPISWSITVGSHTYTTTTQSGAQGTLTITDYPFYNSDFGDNEINASITGASDSVTVKIFFPQKGTENPPPGSTPNFFWYYRYGFGIAPSDLIYDSDIRFGRTNCRQAGNTFTAKPIRMGTDAAGSQYGSQYMDCFDRIYYHELWHRFNYEYNIGNWNSCKPPAAQDPDGDGVSNYWEWVYNTDKNKFDTYTEDHHPNDDEYIAYLNENPIDNTYRDWAKPGLQWNP